jgi:hypothetical protein
VAPVQDRALGNRCGRPPVATRLRRILADGAYADELELGPARAYANGGGTVGDCAEAERTKRIFRPEVEVQVERTSLGSAGIGDADATTNAYRRPRKHIYVAMIRLMTRRLVNDAYQDY